MQNEKENKKIEVDSGFLFKVLKQVDALTARVGELERKAVLPENTFTYEEFKIYAAQRDKEGWEELKRIGIVK